MSITTTAVPAPASRREQNAIQHDIEALEDPRSERSAGKGTVSTNSQLQIY
jgi:hypothetical protein